MVNCQRAIVLTSFGLRLWPGINRVQGKPGLAWDVKLANGQRVHLLYALILVGTTLQLLETLGNVQSKVNEHSVDL